MAEKEDMSEEEDMVENPVEEDTFKILIATDNHLGFAEKIPERSEDSFRAFEEILKLAVDRSVDFVLLGGDLFHEARPSPYTIYKCLDLLRKYCFGDKPVEFEFLSDQSYHFSHMRNPIVNYEDPNLNISVPVFTIHGNHDDPTGTKQISALDIVASSGLVNYFGRWNDLTKVEVAPILLQKGATKLALYGLSHIRDERLGRLFRDKKVTFLKPEGQWFNVLVLHQNRCDGRGRKNFVPVSVLPDFLDLVIWGHEHDCLIKAMKTENNIYISQPGSSVQTSLSVGESLQKQVGILHIYKSHFRMDYIPLKSVRPFVFDELTLEKRDADDIGNRKGGKTVEDHALEQVRRKIESMIEKANNLQKDNTNKLLPLIRLIVKYNDERQTFNAIRFGQTFKDRIANPEEVIVLKHTRLRERDEKLTVDGEILDEMGKPEDWADRVEDIIQKYFESDDKKQKLVVCSVKGLAESVRRFVDKNDVEAIELTFSHQLKKTVDKLEEISPELNSVPDCLENLRLIREQDGDKDVRDIVNILDDQERLARLPRKSADSEDEDDMTIFDDDMPNNDTGDTPQRPARGKGSRGGRVKQPRASATRGRGGKGAKNNMK